MLTAAEIREQQFGRAIRGYEPSEVHSFLHSLASVWERQQELIQRLRNEVEQLRSQSHSQQAEPLAGLLADAEELAHARIAAAEDRADAIRRNAKTEAQILLFGYTERLAQLRGFLEAQLHRIEEFERNTVILPSEKHMPVFSDTLVGPPADDQTGGF